MRLRAIAAGVLVVSIGLIFLFVQRTPAQGTGLLVVTSVAIKPSLEGLAPQIEQAIGLRFTTQFGTSSELREKIQSGAPFDVVILSSDVIDGFIKQGKIAAGTRAGFGRTGMGVGIRAGAPKLDISTPEALKQTLQSAKSITFNPTVASAPHIREMFEHLGIAEDVKSKLMPDTDPRKAVADGKAEIIIAPIAEIMFFNGIELAGPIPAGLQFYISFAAGAATNTHNASAAEALIKYITGPAAAPTLKAKGFEPR